PTMRQAPAGIPSLRVAKRIGSWGGGMRSFPKLTANRGRDWQPSGAQELGPVEVRSEELFAIMRFRAVEGEELLQFLERYGSREKPNLSICEQNVKAIPVRTMNKRVREAVQRKVLRGHPVNPGMGNLDHKDNGSSHVLEAILPILPEGSPRAGDGNDARMELLGRTFFRRPTVSQDPCVCPVPVCLGIPWLTKFHLR